MSLDVLRLAHGEKHTASELLVGIRIFLVKIVDRLRKRR